MSDEKSLSIAQIAAVGSFVGMIIFAFLFFENRYDAKGMSLRAELNAKIYTTNMEIQGQTAVIDKFNLREELEGTLSDADKARREQLRSQRQILRTRVESFDSTLTELGLP